MYLQTLFILLSIRSTFCDFLPVPGGCKYWSYLNVYGNGETKKMHCILDQDYQPGLVYTNWKIISNGTCPIYNRFAKEIDSIPCDGAIGRCSKNSFPSYSGVSFTGCYDAIMKQTNMKRPTGIDYVHGSSTTPDQQFKLKILDANENAHASIATSERQIKLKVLVANENATADRNALIVVAILFGITIFAPVVCCVACFKYRLKVKTYKEMYEALTKEHEEPKYHWPIPLLVRNRSPRGRNDNRLSVNASDCTSGEHGYFTE